MRVDVVISSGQFEEHVDELDLTPNIFPAYPPSLPLTDHVHGFVALNRRRAAWNSRKPGLALTRRLMAR
jgi:hypothetical protein